MRSLISLVCLLGSHAYDIALHLAGLVVADCQSGFLIGLALLWCLQSSGAFLFDVLQHCYFCLLCCLFRLAKKVLNLALARDLVHLGLRLRRLSRARILCLLAPSLLLLCKLLSLT